MSRAYPAGRPQGALFLSLLCTLEGQVLKRRTEKVSGSTLYPTPVFLHGLRTPLPQACG